LSGIRHSILAIVLKTLGRLDVATALNHLFNLLRTLLALRRVGPDVAPVLPIVVRVTSANGIEHVFGRVCMGRTFRTAIGLEVIDEVLGVVSKRTVEHYATTRLEKKKLVKVLKEDSGGLMDCAQNGLACVSELAKEANNVEGSTGVETRGRLVKEHQKFRLGSQLDTNSQSLSLLGV